MKRTTFLLLFGGLMSLICAQSQEDNVISLNGLWTWGVDRSYQRTTTVPGLVVSGDSLPSKCIWLKRKVERPAGQWTSATLLLKGARFDPTVYLNGKLIGQQKGGMAPLQFQLPLSQLQVGRTLELEIMLQPLNRVDKANASYIPEADHWRSNVSSSLWDDVELRFHNEVYIDRFFPVTEYDQDLLTIKYDLATAQVSLKGYKLTTCLIDKNGKVVVEGSKLISKAKGEISIDFMGKVDSWSPNHPELYHLYFTLEREGQVQDQVSCSYGKKKFITQGKQFYLNNNPITARGASVVWHRWVRNSEGEALGWNEAWFVENIVKRLKNLGANTLRFHLGTPPEKFLDLCDQYGLLVQYEWIFFHGMSASESSLLEQWPAWFDLGMKHPCVSIFHPYNETYGDQLKIAQAALDIIVPDYQPIALEDRDIIHLHKYWWSLFENVGVYYDSIEQFPKAVMVDEYGGNYLDGAYNLGAYPAVPQAYMRFLGRHHTQAMRKEHQILSAVKISEYWRQLGAAGYLPFCALSSADDGNNWFEGPLKNGTPKPIWAALASSFSPVSVTINEWDRNFHPLDQKTVELYLYNDSPESRTLNIELSLMQGTHKIMSKELCCDIDANEALKKAVPMVMPSQEGTYMLTAWLKNSPNDVKTDVVSTWKIHVISPKVPESVKEIVVAVDSTEHELRRFLKQNNIQVVSPQYSEAQVLLGSRSTWEKLIRGEATALLEKYIEAGKHVILLDVGDRLLGQGYVDMEEKMNFLQESPIVKVPTTHHYPIIKGLTLTSTELAEPESHIQPSLADSSLWWHLPYDAHWLWNGYKGGLIVPAVDMSIEGLNPEAFLTQWEAKGADVEKLKQVPYYAYELQGYYRFSLNSEDEELTRDLRAYVQFIVEDAPALAGTIDPNAPINTYALHEIYRKSQSREVTSLTPLVNAGKDLVRVPAVKIAFASNEGKLIISQLLTQGRLISQDCDRRSCPHQDAAAQQLLLNMIESVAQ